MANLDENGTQAALAVTDDAGQTPTPIKVDPSTGRVMVAIKAVASLPATVSPTIKTDANRDHIAIAVTDDANKTPKPIICDADGNLICDITVE